MRTPVLWLCGPPGVGKTSVAWRLYVELNRGGARAAYVDIDQLGMCYPARPEDPDRYRLKADNLRALVGVFREAGARCVVVSGVVDPVEGIDPARLGGGIALTLVRLRAGGDELRARFLSRGAPSESVDDVLAEAEAYDSGDFGRCVETSGLSIEQVLAAVRTRIVGWPGDDDSDDGDDGDRDRDGTEPAATADEISGQVLWLCGATGVGKSTVGWQVWTRIGQSGATTAYVDLDQVGFLQPPTDDPGNDRLRSRNLAAVWRTFRAAGAESLVVVGHAADRSEYAAALPGANLTVVRLHASRETLAARIAERGRGGGWPAPGDPLRGQPASTLRAVADSAATDAIALERADFGDHRVLTDGRSVEAIADDIADAVGPLTAPR